MQAINDFFNTIMPQEHENSFRNYFFKFSNIRFALHSRPSEKQYFLSRLLSEIQKIKNTSALSDDAKKTTIKNLLCLLPLGLTNETFITLPIWHNGKMINAEYRVAKIPLTPWFLPQSDQYYAIALSPIQSGLPSQLIMKGTPPPSDQGFWSAIFADLFSLRSIGWPMTRRSEALIAWSKQQTAIESTGQSLGGAVMLAHAEHLHHLKTLDLFNPALPVSSSNIDTQTSVNIHFNKNDPVQKLGGIVPNHADIYSYDIDKPETSFLFKHLLPHIQCYSATNSQPAHTKGSHYNHQNKKLSAFLIYFILRTIAFMLFLPIYIVHIAIKLTMKIFSLPLKLFKTSPTPTETPPGYDYKPTLVVTRPKHHQQSKPRLTI